MPQSSPSSRARRWAIVIASSSLTTQVASMTLRSRMAGMTPSPIPICKCVPMLPPANIAAFSGSAAQTMVSGFACLSAPPMPEMEPPVPKPQAKPSMTMPDSLASSRISTAVCVRWMATLSTFENWSGMKALGSAAACSRASSAQVSMALPMSPSS